MIKICLGSPDSGFKEIEATTFADLKISGCQILKIPLQSDLTLTDSNKQNIADDDDVRYIIKKGFFVVFNENLLKEETCTNMPNRKEQASTTLSNKIRKIAEANTEKQKQDINGLKIIMLPMQEGVTQIKEYEIRSFKFGEEVSEKKKENRSILLTGMTGAGKSLFINNMVNYVLGVNFEDDFRFKIICEYDEFEDQRKSDASVQSTNADCPTTANSMTSWVTTYTLYWQEGFRIPFNLTIIDTPGFGHTEGELYDGKIVAQMKQLYHSDIIPDREISAISFVIKSSEARITKEQKILFDKILCVFSKKVEKNIFIVFSYAGVDNPAALSVVKKDQIPFSEYFKFDNIAAYAPKTNPMSMHLWQFCKDSFKAYFKAVKKIQPVSLETCREVLNEQEMLCYVQEAIEERIFNIIDSLYFIEYSFKVMKDLEGPIAEHKSKKMFTRIESIVVEDINHNSTNCKNCQFTCHEPCNVVLNCIWACSEIKLFGNKCRICPKRCSIKHHVTEKKKYTTVFHLGDKTIEKELLENNIDVNDPNAIPKYFKILLKKYQKQKFELFYSLQEANECTERLNKIALRNNSMNIVDYIDSLIVRQAVKSEAPEEPTVATRDHEDQEVQGANEEVIKTESGAACSGPNKHPIEKPNSRPEKLGQKRINQWEQRMEQHNPNLPQLNRASSQRKEYPQLNRGRQIRYLHYMKNTAQHIVNGKSIEDAVQHFCPPIEMRIYWKLKELDETVLRSDCGISSAFSPNFACNEETIEELEKEIIESFQNVRQDISRGKSRHFAGSAQSEGMVKRFGNLIKIFADHGKK